MSSASTQPVTITISDTQRVSGLLLAPSNARACYVLAHGAGAGMTHPFIAAVANGLAERGIATLRMLSSDTPPAPRAATIPPPRRAVRSKSHPPSRPPTSEGSDEPGGDGVATPEG